MMDQAFNFYDQRITPPEYFDGEHIPNPMGKGLPPVCACGWTRHKVADRWFEMADHLRDMALGRSYS